MRTRSIRYLLALAVLLTWAAGPASAQQGLVRGKVVDASGNAVAGAVVVFEAQNFAMRREAKTDNRGEFLMIGMQSGEYKVTASKEGVGIAEMMGPVKQGQNEPLNFTLRPAAPAGPVVATESADKKAAAALQALAKTASDHLTAGRNDEAIASFSEIVAKAPTCADCYFNLGIAHMNKKDYTEAESAFKKAVEINADHADAHTQLAAVYNAQRKFDLAAEHSARAAKASAAAGGGGNAEALFNQGVSLFNGGKFAEARTAFEGAVKADPAMAMAHYQLGMTALNLGDFAQAVSSLETYLKLDPNGPRAAEVKASLPTLQGMVKK